MTRTTPAGASELALRAAAHGLSRPGEKGFAKFDPVGDKKGTREELAKQVCAFSNAGDGFLVYGIIDKVGGLDPGVEDAIGRQPVKAWVEQYIPALPIHPPVTGCQAKLIHCPAITRPAAAPWWYTSPQAIDAPLGHRGDGASIPRCRLALHPMRLQTLLDISSRGSTPVVEIEDIGMLNAPVSNSDRFSLSVNPVVRLAGQYARTGHSISPLMLRES
jgi:hypothetical protein